MLYDRIDINIIVFYDVLILCLYGEHYDFVETVTLIPAPPVRVDDDCGTN